MPFISPERALYIIPALPFLFAPGTQNSFDGPSGGNGCSGYSARRPQPPPATHRGPPAPLVRLFAPKLRPVLWPPVFHCYPDSARPERHRPWTVLMPGVRYKKHEWTCNGPAPAPEGQESSPARPSLACLRSNAFSRRCKSVSNDDIWPRFLSHTNTGTPNARLTRVSRLLME